MHFRFKNKFLNAPPHTFSSMYGIHFAEIQSFGIQWAIDKAQRKTASVFALRYSYRSWKYKKTEEINVCQLLELARWMLADIATVWFSTIYVFFYLWSVLGMEV
jgi:hypothetical protein